MIQYIIVDDETIAHEIIEDYCKNLPNLQLAKHCYNAFEALAYLKDHPVDLIFLDINMPKISGFEMLKSLRKPPKVIITTAYEEFAVESYELEVVDYLLKPFSLSRFLKAVNKVEINFKQSSETEPPSSSPKYIFLKEGTKHIQVLIEDILFIESYGNYNKVRTKSKTITTLEKLSAYLDILPPNDFIQIHKSFIVSKSKIAIIQNNTVYIDQYKLPIGQTYKHQVNNMLKS